MNGFPGASGWNCTGGDAGWKVFTEILLKEATGGNSVWTPFGRKEALVQPGKHAGRNGRVVLSDLELGDSIFWKS